LLFNFPDQPKQLLSGHAASPPAGGSPVPDILGLVSQENSIKNAELATNRAD